MSINYMRLFCLALLACFSIELKAMEKGKDTELSKIRTQFALFHYARARNNHYLRSQVAIPIRLLRRSGILQRAVVAHDTELMNLLLADGSNPAQLNEHGQNSLHIALLHDNPDAVMTLLNRVNLEGLLQRDVYGYTALDYARQRGYHDIVQALRSRIVELKSALHCAVHSGDAERVRQVLAEYPELLNARDDEGYSAVHYALVEGFDEIARILISLGADIDTTYVANHVSRRELAAPQILPSPRDYIRNIGNLDLLRMLPRSLH